jgi:hypothetical protein
MTRVYAVHKRYTLIMDIYAICDGSEIRYIGQSVDGHARQRQHWNDRNRRSCSLHKWLRTLDEPPPYQIIAIVEDDLAHGIERAAIIALRQITNGRLLNDKVRGSVSAETRARLSEARRGRTISAEARAKIGAANRGRAVSPELAEARRQRALAQWADPARRDAVLSGQRSETGRRNRAAAQAGKSQSQETRAKISAAKKAQWTDPEYREKTTNAHVGRTASAETRAKLSAAIADSWQRRKLNE